STAASIRRNGTNAWRSSRGWCFVTAAASSAVARGCRPAGLLASVLFTAIRQPRCSFSRADRARRLTILGKRFARAVDATWLRTRHPEGSGSPLSATALARWRQSHFVSWWRSEERRVGKEGRWRGSGEEEIG